jgi:hypothetical protein
VKYLKGFGLVLVGFITGVIATQYLFVKSTERYIEAQNDFQSVISKSLDTIAEKELREQRLKFKEAQSLFESYREGDDVTDYLFVRIEEMKKDLILIEKTLIEETSPELYKDYKHQLDELEQLEEDINFYFGPPS